MILSISVFQSFVFRREAARRSVCHDFETGFPGRGFPAQDDADFLVNDSCRIFADREVGRLFSQKRMLFRLVEGSRHLSLIPH